LAAVRRVFGSDITLIIAVPYADAGETFRYAGAYIPVVAMCGSGSAFPAVDTSAVPPRAALRALDRATSAPEPARFLEQWCGAEFTPGSPESIEIQLRKSGRGAEGIVLVSLPGHRPAYAVLTNDGTAVRLFRAEESGSVRLSPSLGLAGWTQALALSLPDRDQLQVAFLRTDGRPLGDGPTDADPAGPDGGNDGDTQAIAPFTDAGLSRSEPGAADPTGPEGSDATTPGLGSAGALRDALARLLTDKGLAVPEDIPGDLGVENLAYVLGGQVLGQGYGAPADLVHELGASGVVDGVVVVESAGCQLRQVLMVQCTGAPGSSDWRARFTDPSSGRPAVLLDLGPDPVTLSQRAAADLDADPAMGSVVSQADFPYSNALTYHLVDGAGLSTRGLLPWPPSHQVHGRVAKIDSAGQVRTVHVNVPDPQRPGLRTVRTVTVDEATVQWSLRIDPGTPHTVFVTGRPVVLSGQNLLRAATPGLVVLPGLVDGAERCLRESGVLPPGADVEWVLAQLRAADLVACLVDVTGSAGPDESWRVVGLAAGVRESAAAGEPSAGWLRYLLVAPAANPSAALGGGSLGAALRHHIAAELGASGVTDATASRVRPLALEMRSLVRRGPAGAPEIEVIDSAISWFASSAAEQRVAGTTFWAMRAVVGEEPDLWLVYPEYGGRRLLADPRPKGWREADPWRMEAATALVAVSDMMLEPGIDEVERGLAESVGEPVRWSASGGADRMLLRPAASPRGLLMPVAEVESAVAAEPEDLWAAVIRDFMERQVAVPPRPGVPGADEVAWLLGQPLLGLGSLEEAVAELRGWPEGRGLIIGVDADHVVAEVWLAAEDPATDSVMFRDA
ncbi:MAG: hypothetical protein ACRCYU_13185, partial [Nocardioides sp.]